MPRPFYLLPGTRVRVAACCPLEERRGKTGGLVRVTVEGLAVVEPDEFDGSLGLWRMRPEWLERIT
jgi:hypothetical protein